MAEKKAEKKAGGDNGITDIPHEDVSQTVRTQTAEVMVNQQIRMEIKKFNLADAAIAAMKEKYGALTIKGPEDKEGYKAVKEAWNDTRSKRTGLEKKGLEIRSGYTVIGKAIKKEEDRLVELLDPLETDLYKKWKDIDDEKDRIKKAKEEAEQRELMARIEEVMGLGMTLRDGMYVIGDTISMDVASLRALPADQYDKFKGVVKAKAAELKKISDDLAEQKRQDGIKLKAEQDKLKREQDELQKQKDDLQRQQEQLKKDQESAAKVKREMRTSKLLNLGMTYAQRADLFEFDNGFKSVTHGGALLFDMDDYGFEEHFKVIDGLIKESKDGKERHDEELEKGKRALETRKNFIAKAMETAGLVFSYTAQSFQWEDKNTAIEVKFADLILLDEAAITLKANDLATQIGDAKKLTIDSNKKAKDEADKEAKLALNDRDRFFADVAGLEAIVGEIKPAEYKTKKFQVIATKLKADITNVLKALK